MEKEDLMRLNTLLGKYETCPLQQVTVEGSEIQELAKLARKLGVLTETYRIDKEKSRLAREEKENELAQLREISARKLNELKEKVEELGDEEQELPEFYVIVWTDEGRLYYRAFEGDRPDRFYSAIGDVPKAFFQGDLIQEVGLEDDDEWVAKRQQKYLRIIQALGGELPMSSSVPVMMVDETEGDEDDPEDQ